MSTEPKEPSDHYVYQFVSLNRDTMEFFRAATRFYESRLSADLEAVRQDADLKELLSDEVLQTYPVAREQDRVARVLEWFENKMAAGSRPSGYDVDMSHQLVRFLKSVSLLYLEHLRRKRRGIASRPTTSKALLEAIDQQLARMEEKTHLGVFGNASPYPLVLDQLPPEAGASTVDAARGTRRRREARPAPVILDTIEIRDPALRKRCLDLLAQFQQDGQHERLDTVVAEATRILEDRLRSLVGAPSTTVGTDLAQFAFGTPNLRLIVSDIAPEQQAANLLYRGVFGFIRNSAGHRLLGPLQPERVLQIVGMVDYLLSVAEAARRAEPRTPTQ